MPLTPATRLGAYEIVAPLGAGGMGEVYRARDTRLGREVALKVLPISGAEEPRRRFLREARSAAALTDPGIATVYDVGEDAGRVFIAMELVRGRTLRAQIEGRPASDRALPVAEALRVGREITRALATAHARGVVHRDLKPDNVLVLPDGSTKVLDFGLAGLHAEGAEALTQSNVAMGTANYMAPEQRKDAHRADHRADLYSFGVMIYELLTGELPVGKFQPASKLVANLDRAWDALIERCLEPDPSARPHSALELAHALEALGGLAPAMELAPRTRRKAQRSRIWSLLGIGSAIAVVFGMAGLRVARDHGGPRLDVRAAAAVPIARAAKRHR
jgi:serine/threonine-protein kinase